MTPRAESPPAESPTRVPPRVLVLVVGIMGLATGACAHGDCRDSDGRRDAAPVPHDNEEGQMTTDAVPCTIHQATDGVTGRTATVLEREKAYFDARAQSLIDGAMSMMAPPAPPAVTVGHILRHLGGPDAALAESAAFVAGRCRAATAEADAQLEEALRSTVATGEHPVARTEAAMGLALRGDKDAALAALRELAASPKPFDEPYKAGLYLAQLGDKAGYTPVAAAMTGDVNHQRIMAVRSISYLQPFDGQVVDGVTVDLRALLVARLSDPNQLVRREVPAQLLLLEVPDAGELLETVVATDSDAGVRAAAEAALAQLRNRP